MPQFGFHPDPRDPEHLLLWDGSNWVDLEGPFNLALPPAPAPARAKTLLYLLALCACAGVATAAALALLAGAVFMAFTASATATVTSAAAVSGGCDLTVQAGSSTLGVTLPECVRVGEALAVRYLPGASTAVLDLAGWVLFLPALVLLGCLAVAVYAARKHP